MVVAVTVNHKHHVEGEDALTEKIHTCGNSWTNKKVVVLDLIKGTYAGHLGGSVS